MSLLKTHPISVKDNLQPIWTEFHIGFDAMETRTDLQVKIDDHAKTNKSNDEKIRNLIKKWSEQHTEQGCQAPNKIRQYRKSLYRHFDFFESQSQLLFSPSQQSPRDDERQEHRQDGNDDSDINLESITQDDVATIVHTKNHQIKNLTHVLSRVESMFTEAMGKLEERQAMRDSLELWFSQGKFSHSSSWQ